MSSAWLMTPAGFRSCSPNARKLLPSNNKREREIERESEQKNNRDDDRTHYPLQTASNNTDVRQTNNYGCRLVDFWPRFQFVYFFLFPHQFDAEGEKQAANTLQKNMNTVRCARAGDNSIYSNEGEPKGCQPVPYFWTRVIFFSSSSSLYSTYGNCSNINGFVRSHT